MSDIEQSETIQAARGPALMDQAPITVIRRKYQRKPKPVEVSDLENSEPVEPVESVEIIKPKRQYNRKPRSLERSHSVSDKVYEQSNSTVDLTPEPTPEPIPEPIPEPTPEPQVEVKEKKARTEKQIAAFNRMREARLKKSKELEDLKAFQKEKELLEKEQAKIQKIEEKIVKKRQPKTPKNKQVDNHTEDHIPQVSTHRPILFV